MVSNEAKGGKRFWAKASSRSQVGVRTMTLEGKRCGIAVPKAEEILAHFPSLW